jgi:hypothetical protein
MKTVPQTPTGRKIWFPAKKYGYGWGFPNCWQGWVFLISWLIALEASAYFLLVRWHHLTLFLVAEPILIVILIVVCLLKGEKPGWRWGDKK